MKVAYRKQFLKQLSKLPLEVKSRVEIFAFEELPALSSLADSGKIEKMTGYTGYYKARFGSYRVGMQLIEDRLVLRTVQHRRDIYRQFP